MSAYLVVAHRRLSVQYVRGRSGSIVHRTEREAARLAELQLRGKCKRVTVVRVSELSDGTWHRAIVATYAGKAA